MTLNSSIKKSEIFTENSESTNNTYFSFLIKSYNLQSETIPDLKGEIHNLQKELIDEKLKVRGLSEALEDPMNVHRWRKLEGTDPDSYEMITKIQTLQKRLIGKTEEVNIISL